VSRARATAVNTDHQPASMIRALSPAQPIHASRRSEARVAQSPHDATLAAMPEVGVKVGSFCSLDSVGVRMVNNNTRFCSLLDNDASVRRLHAFARVRRGFR
jgi:hypothetical protein